MPRKDHVSRPIRYYRGGIGGGEEHPMDIKVLGIDLGNMVCSLAGLATKG